MTAAEFLERFGYFVDAPDGIKRLRELVLQLAVQGKLVPQDPNDEPASILLEKIQTARLKLIADKKVRTTKPLQAITNDDAPYGLPASWQWIRLGDIGDWGAGATPNRKDSSYYGGDMPWFKSGELTGEHISSAEENITEKALRECSLRVCKPGDVLIAMYGATIGKVAVLDVEATTNQAVCACTSYDGVFNRFLLLLLKAYKLRFITQGAGGAQPNISRIKIVNTVAALPPLAEQHRIVAKVDELMALCDQLEAERNARNDTHTRLIRAVHHPLTEASDAASTTTAWRRIRNHFADLYTTRESIQALRQTVLQLATQGKLVAQDVSDGSADDLFAQIAQEKQRLIEGGQIKSGKPLPALQNSELPFEVPEPWRWVRLGDVVIDSEAGWSPKAESTPAADGQWGVLKVSAVSWGEFRASENKALIAGTEPRVQYEVRPGDFLISRANTADLVARSVVVEATPPKLMMSDKIIRLRLSELVSSSYANLFNASQFARDYYAAVAGGTSSSMKNVSRHQIACLPIALAPLAEQHRIVAKVDELMALCDQLDAAITSRDDNASRYAEAVVQQLSAA